MRKFRFRLQRLLDYRVMVEDWAKRDYLDIRVKRIEAESVLETIDTQRQAALSSNATSLPERLALEGYLNRLDDDQRAQQVLISSLITEESNACSIWMDKRRDAEILKKLREKDEKEFLLEMSRKEQASLDEWAVQQRRHAA